MQRRHPWPDQMRRKTDPPCHCARALPRDESTHSIHPIHGWTDIIVDEKNDLTSRFCDATVQAIGLAWFALAGVAKGHAGQRTGLDHRTSIIRRTIIHDQQFRFQTIRNFNGTHCLECLQQVRRSIPGYNDD